VAKSATKNRRNIIFVGLVLGMVTLPKAAPSPLMQWRSPDGELVRARETIGPRLLMSMSTRCCRRQRAIRAKHTPQTSA
jgi:hypothetical protein